MNKPETIFKLFGFELCGTKRTNEIKEFAELRQAWDKMLIEVVKFYRIDSITKWIAKKLNNFSPKKAYKKA